MQFSSKSWAPGKWLPGQRVGGVDLRVLAKGEHEGSLKAEVINTCFLKGSFVPPMP